MKIETIPWMTPNFVRWKHSEGFMESCGVPLKEVEAKTLSQMCDAFRAEVFKKAGKVDPSPPLDGAE